MRYPIGIQDFEKIRRDDYIYVDKTAIIYDLAQKGGYGFLSRPRRFGKSLLISTMEAYFKGKKESFEGLAMAGLEKEWKAYPVLRFDLSGKEYRELSDLTETLSQHLARFESDYGISPRFESPEGRFKDVIDAAYEKTGLPVVILIDEYDKPLMESLVDESLNDSFRSLLQAFYSVMKTKDAYIKFGFLTGVTKIGKLSVFSGLNNLIDISMDAGYVDICGISEKELKAYFPESVKELADANGLTMDQCYERMAKWYDGYHFRQNTKGVYNPFSVLNTFRSLEFRKYWFSTGTPTFLVRYLAQNGFQLENMNGISVPSAVLSGTNASRPSPITLLYQAGYLTIRDYDENLDQYTMVYPNKEVEDGFLYSLADYFASATETNAQLSVNKFVEDIRAGRVEMLMRRFTAFFADMDYQIQGDAELYFQNTMYVMFKLMGQQVEVERHTSNGRINVLVQTDKYVYIIELKRDKDPQDALDQIDEKGYDWPFIANSRKLFKIGATFSTVTRRLENWKMPQ